MAYFVQAVRAAEVEGGAGGDVPAMATAMLFGVYSFLHPFSMVISVRLERTHTFPHAHTGALGGLPVGTRG